MAAEGNICEKKIEAENPGWRGISKKIDNFFFCLVCTHGNIPVGSHITLPFGGEGKIMKLNQYNHNITFG